MFPLVWSWGWRPSWSSTGPLQARGGVAPPWFPGCVVLPGRGGPCLGPVNTTMGQRVRGHPGASVRLAPGQTGGRLPELTWPPPAAGPDACRPPHPPTARPLPPSIGSCSSLLLLESSNFEKMSFCQIRRDSLWSFLRSVRTQSQPLVPGPSHSQALLGARVSGLGSALPPLRVTPVQRPNSSHA